MQLGEEFFFFPQTLHKYINPLEKLLSTEYYRNSDGKCSKTFLFTRIS